MTDHPAVRALEVAEPGSIALVDRPDQIAMTTASASGGSSLKPVKPLLVGLCGTDLDIIDGLVDEAFVTYPIVLGHEWVGEALGPNDEPRRVIAEGIVPCTMCDDCRRGATNLCAVYDEYGFTRDGAAAGRVLVPERLLHDIGGNVSIESAVLAEPAAVVHHALERARPEPGARVLVVGDGTIALLAAHLVRSWRPSVVDVRGRRTAQLGLVERAGADRFLLDQPGSTGQTGSYDLVIDAAGSPEASAAAVRSLERGGTLVALGYLGRGVTVPLTVDDLINRELSVLGSFASTSEDWRSIASSLNDDTLDLSWLVTHRFPLPEFRAAIEELRRPTGARGKIVLVP
ncbi:zinc-dependent alcohol dehydrogenase [Plantibacter sp. YIM 135347]|uniref:zinc-dependent alcohol dehydrogenase n=1 Tax=Plantibacter sp. YIM 135347 TaxID=3423919 RepID=UPI003D33E232